MCYESRFVSTLTHGIKIATINKWADGMTSTRSVSVLPLRTVAACMFEVFRIR